MTLKCSICRNGQTELGTTTVTLERGDLTLVIKGVPAEVCDNCGEAYVDEKIAGNLLETAEADIRAGVKVEVRQYRAA